MSEPEEAEAAEQDEAFEDEAGGEEEQEEAEQQEPQDSQEPQESQEQGEQAEPKEPKEPKEPRSASKISSSGGKAKAASKAKGKAAKEAEKLAKEIEWLMMVEPGTEAKEVLKVVLAKLKASIETPNLELFCAACQAAGNVCQSLEGFQRFFKGGGVETLMGAVADLPWKVQKEKKEKNEDKGPAKDDKPWATDTQKKESAEKKSRKDMAAKEQEKAEKAAARALAKEAADQAKAALNGAVEECADGAGEWLASLDYVDFQEMGNFVYIGSWLAGHNEDLALEVMETIHRSVLDKVENAVALLQGGALHVLHKILVHHRAPELVEEAFQMLVRLCDLPQEATEDYVVPMLLEEPDLVKTVVESMEHGPLNLRMQLQGLRIMSIWARMESHEVRNLLRKNQKPLTALFEGTEHKLGKAGYAHVASWVSTIASRQLKVALSKEDAKLAKKAGVE